MAFKDSHSYANAMAGENWYEAHGVGRTGMKIKRFLDSKL
jgi:hypothetical protein